MAKRTSTKAKSSSKTTASKKSSKAKPAAAQKTAAAGEKEVTIDRRRADRSDDTEATEDSPAGADQELTPRKKVNRRRQIDPTTCERDYSDQEVEFMNALDEYKRANGRMFPTCSEVLEVIRSLGYAQLSAAELAAREPAPTAEGEQASENFAGDFDPNQEEDCETFDEAFV